MYYYIVNYHDSNRDSYTGGYYELFDKAYDAIVYAIDEYTKYYDPESRDHASCGKKNCFLGMDITERVDKLLIKLNECEDITYPPHESCDGTEQDDFFRIVKVRLRASEN